MTDTTRPVLVSLTLPKTVDYLTSKDLHVEVKADDGDGSGINYIDIAFDKPLTTTLSSLPGLPSIGYITIGNYIPHSGSAYSFTAQVGAYSAPGTYNIQQVTVADVAGNYSTYSPAQLASLGIQTSFTLTGTTADVTPPQLKALSIPALIDESKGPVVVKVSGTAGDDLAGVDSVAIWLDKDMNRSFDLHDPAQARPSNLIALGSTMNDWANGPGSLSFLAAAANGVYNISYVQVGDMAGNLAYYSPLQLAALGVNTSIVVSDGTFHPAKVAASVAVGARTAAQAGEIVVKLSADQWHAEGNSFDATFSYDPTVAKFADWRVGAGGGTVDVQTTEVGPTGLLKVSVTVPGGVTAADFLELYFKPAGAAGTFALGMSGAHLNAATLQNDFGTKAGFLVPAQVDGAAHATVSYAGKQADYHVTHANGGVTVTPVGAGSAAAMAPVEHVERIAFADHTVAFDSAAAQLARLYQAAFDRVPDAGGLGFWIKALDNGMSLAAIARDFSTSDEFHQRYGVAPTNAELVDHFYLNVLHRTGDAAGVAFWLDGLDHHGLAVAEVLADFSASPENQAQTATLVGNGIVFTPYA